MFISHVVYIAQKHLLLGRTEQLVGVSLRLGSRGRYTQKPPPQRRVLHTIESRCFPVIWLILGFQKSHSMVDLTHFWACCVGLKFTPKKWSVGRFGRVEHSAGTDTITPNEREYWSLSQFVLSAQMAFREKQWDSLPSTSTSESESLWFLSNALDAEEGCLTTMFHDSGKLVLHMWLASNHSYKNLKDYMLF